MFTINNKPIFNFYNISTILRGNHLKTTEEKIENYIKYVNEIVFIRNSVIEKKKKKAYNIPLNEFCGLNPVVHFHTKQIDFDKNIITDSENSIAIKYQDLFALNSKQTFDDIIVSNDLTPEEIYMRKEWDISLEQIDQSWSRNLYNNMLPKFYFEWKHITPEFINTLLIVYTLIVKACQYYLMNITKNFSPNISWESLDKLINDLNSELHFENCKLKETDSAYNLMTILCCGQIEFYHKMDDFIIFTPLYPLYSGSDKEILEIIYKTFIENPVKYNHLIACLVHNFVKDELDIPIKLILPKKSLFLGEIPGDNVIDLTVKICNTIFNKTNIKSGDNNVYCNVYSQVKSLYEFSKICSAEIENGYQIQQKKYLIAKENEDITDLTYISKFQINIKNVIIMRILTEIVSGEKINFSLKYKNSTKHKITNYIVSLWDNLINDMLININKEELIGIEYHDINDFMMFILNIKFTPRVPYHYVNSHLMYINRNDAKFIQWMNDLCKYERLHTHCKECWKNISKLN